MKTNWLLSFIFIGMLACQPTLPPDVVSIIDELPPNIDYNQHVKPILSDKCFSCHGPDENKLKAGLRLDIEELAKGDLPENTGKKAIVSGSLKRSQVFHRILSSDSEIQMPPPESNLSLNAIEKAILIKWIEEGAVYQPHWAFSKANKQDPPPIKNDSLIKNSIDVFIQHKLEQKGFTLAPEADKETLLRRLSLDLTGLPPSIEEMDAFIQDENPDAYERQVNRLLDSPHYGEKMATDWMDLARFADTHGYQSDRFRDVSPWRDWVIKSFNENMPYDDFITWQLAGDLLPNPTKQQRLATAFLRLHPQNEEGGIVEEEFKVEYAVDRVNTLGTAFMAMTLSCAKCHSHKFDPISQEDYYQLYGFFNNIKEAGQISFDGAMPVPTMLLTDEKKDSVIAFLEKEVALQADKVESLLNANSKGFEAWLNTKDYKKLLKNPIPKNPSGQFSFNGKNLKNQKNPNQRGQMKLTSSANEKPTYFKGYDQEGLLLNGDSWLDLYPIGQFKRSESFSVGLWINLPKNLKDGVIFHKGVGAALYNFKGFHLALKNDKLELLMAKTAPFNAIIEETFETVPKDEWIHLTLTYDGSSEADGLKVFLNGKEMNTSIQNNNLYKNIQIGWGNQKEVGLQIGARWRGKGIGGAIVDDIIVFNRELNPLEILQLSKNPELKILLEKEVNDLTSSEKESLKSHYLKYSSNDFTKEKDLLERKRQELNDSLEVIPELMIMEEMETPKPSFVLDRGQYDAPLEEVFPNTPNHILPMPEDLPKNRLGLAKWLSHPDHPLTARVAVNRYWQQYFGRGIVETTEDFGNQGDLPSHPALLDWLAIYFQESGWDVKALQKLIVLSATYRQSSKASEKLREIDPSNQLLGRGPSKRLSAEMIRDNVLAASGLLHRKIGGKSVYPYQPEGLWKVNNRNYPQSIGVDLYRRSLYTVWKRSVPHPTQMTFDAPERSECTVRRQETNTPLQALVLMNDPIFIEAAKMLGAEIAKKEDITTAFRKLTGRKPLISELKVLEELYDQKYATFQKDITKTSAWLITGNPQIPKEKQAAYAVLVSTIINSDAVIVKR